MTKYHDYIVLARDASDITIASIKAIDAFSSTGSLSSVRRKVAEDVASGKYAKHGDVVVWVVSQGSSTGTRNPRRADGVLKSVLTPKVIQVDYSGWDETYVRIVYDNGDLSDDECFSSKEAAQARAKVLAKQYGVTWESNY